MDFNAAAAGWDASEPRVRRAAAVADRIREILGPAGRERALEFGCGTGLLSMALSDVFETIICLDSSEGMLEVLKGKLGKGEKARIIPLLADLEKEDIVVEPVDAVYMLMALHHAGRIEPVLGRLSSLLKPGGLIFIADLDREDGSFHANEPGFSGHNGFDRGELGVVLHGAGFGEAAFETVFTMEREANGVKRTYTVFLASAGKKKGGAA